MGEMDWWKARGQQVKNNENRQQCFSCLILFSTGLIFTPAGCCPPLLVSKIKTVQGFCTQRHIFLFGAFISFPSESFYFSQMSSCWNCTHFVVVRFTSVLQTPLKVLLGKPNEDFQCIRITNSNLIKTCPSWFSEKNKLKKTAALSVLSHCIAYIIFFFLFFMAASFFSQESITNIPCGQVVQGFCHHKESFKYVLFNLQQAVMFSFLFFQVYCRL